MQWRHRHGSRGRRAVRVGHNSAVPPAPPSLRLEQAEVWRVHFGNDERHVGIHPMILCVAQYDATRARKCLLHVASNTAVQRREYEWRLYLTWVTTNDDTTGEVRRQ
jgi:hypothetical protein